MSGPLAGAIGRSLAGREFLPRLATVCLFHGEDGAPLDRGLALYFAGPASFTGEDVLELHAHGGPALLRLLLDRCLAAGARLARPGEFTQRAFLNGKLDLAQAESVADLIEAATAAAVRAAARNLEGALSQAVRELDAGLVNLRAELEAAIDFAEEDGVVLVPEERLHAQLAGLFRSCSQLLLRTKQGRLLGDGLNVVLVGAPNVGKSSLFNRIAGRDLAIVTPVPGTTRDALREALALQGVPLHLVDTAGLRESRDEVELLGMERTRRSISHADLALVIVAPPQGVAELPRLLEELPADLPRIIVHNKADLSGEAVGIKKAGPTPELVVSAKTGSGVEVLSELMLDRVGWKPGAEEVLLAHSRHVDALRETAARLEAAQAMSGKRELLAEELRLAHRALGQISGEFLPDDLLGEIFRRFCIGK